MDSNPEKHMYNWGMDATLDVIGGKWKPLILYELNDETLRFSQLLDRVQNHPEDAYKTASPT
jgi:DNA-binding HxlR family transcriptional regulator